MADLDFPDLQAFETLSGETAIGFARRDSPIIHVIFQAKPGTPFRVDEHFAVCSVCRFHGMTIELFHAWWILQESRRTN